MITILSPIPCPFADKKGLEKISSSIMLKEKKYNPKTTNVTIIFIDDRQMKKMNTQWRKKNKTTDILSFNINEQEGKIFQLGELYLSVNQIKKQAKDLGHTSQNELSILFIHGLLHLHAYEHEYGASEKTIAIMEKREMLYRKRWISSPKVQTRLT